MMSKEFDFERTVCSCRHCQAGCEHSPGLLIPSDLDRLIPDGADPFVWAEEHLRAAISRVLNPLTETLFLIPALIPAKSIMGHCHWYKNGLCDVHDRSPFGCAYSDTHMGKGATRQRAEFAIKAKIAAATNEHSLYFRVWSHLSEKGLKYTPEESDRDAKAISKARDRIRRQSRPKLQSH